MIDSAAKAGKMPVKETKAILTTNIFSNFNMNILLI
jgi:hypothetical protein